MTAKQWLRQPVYIAVVWWTDSCFLDDSVTERDDPSIGLVQGVSAGIVVEVTKEHIALAHDTWEAGDYRGIQVISRACVKKVRYMKL
jgi:hypothetical protein